MKVALVHDYLNQYGGAERVLQALCELFPDAPIFTLVYDKKGTNNAFATRRIVTSFLQRVPGAARYHRIFPLIMPLAIETLDVQKYDLVISDSEGFGKGIITSPGAVHISYCHTPPRFLWDGWYDTLQTSNLPTVIRRLVPFGLTYLRMWDMSASQRVSQFIANSSFVAKRIAKYYRREAKIIYPPVSLEQFSGQWQKKDYYLLLMRLVPYKHPEIAIQAFNKLSLPLRVVGAGPLFTTLKRMAKPNIEFLGALPHSEVAQQYGQARALIFPQEEDFGISAIESCASGTPVIAYRSGGAKETIKEGINGIFFDKQTPKSLTQSILPFQKMQFNDTIIKQSVSHFGLDRFKQEFSQTVLNLTRA